MSASAHTETIASAEQAQYSCCGDKKEYKWEPVVGRVIQGATLAQMCIASFEPLVEVFALFQLSDASHGVATFYRVYVWVRLVRTVGHGRFEALGVSKRVSDAVLDEFWRCISNLTTRTRNHLGQWVGSPEVEAWNRQNTQGSATSRNPKQCVIELDQASCRSCRDAKMACDRKLQFLFESTREEYFYTMEEFVTVFNAKKTSRCRSFQKTANKRRKASLPYAKILRNKIVSAPEAAILVDSSAQNGVCSRDDYTAAYSEVERRLLKERVIELERQIAFEICQ
ncbi:hypothetical protein B0H16DRAFT_1447886 [Mycena metata]|uniref:Uncharacterized protein n=1 Tax=Mycena metata TaxID=1033252 RepID=A0AAD7KBU3_9AGAR|nr:hypothetical protein B0H16DRAFT_1447886 [Mycena metata]